MSQTPGSVTGVVPRYQNCFSHTCEIVGARINREIAKHFFTYDCDHRELHCCVSLWQAGLYSYLAKAKQLMLIFCSLKFKSILLNVLYATLAFFTLSVQLIT